MPERILSQHELAEIAQRDKARTQGGWSARIDPGDLIGTVFSATDGGCGCYAKSDAEFLVNCINDIPRLLETVKATRRMLYEAYASGYAQHRPGCIGMYLKGSGADAEWWPCKCGYHEWREAVTRILEGNDV